MRYINLILATSYALLVDAAPAPIPAPDGLLVPRDGEVSRPDCGSLASDQKWGSDKAPWIADANNAGAPFCATTYNKGHRILELAAWKEGSGRCDGKGAMTRLEITFSDGSNMAIGSSNKACEAGKMSLKDDEIITSVTSWRAGDRPDAQGKTQIKTNKNQDIYLKDEYSPHDHNAWTQDVKSGVLIGLTGYMVGDAIMQIDFQFLEGKVTKMWMANFDYDPNALKAININKRRVFGHSFTNGDPDHDATFELDSTTEVSHSVHNEHETIDTMGFSISMTEGISVRDIVKVDSTQNFQWSTENRDLTTTDDFERTEVKWNMAGTVGPLMTTDCDVYSGSVTGRIPYTARQYMEFDNGVNTYWYPTNGIVDATDLVGTSKETTCTPRPMNSTDMVSPPGELKPVPSPSAKSSSVIQSSIKASTTSGNVPEPTEEPAPTSTSQKAKTTTSTKITTSTTQKTSMTSTQESKTTKTTTTPKTSMTSTQESKTTKTTTTPTTTQKTSTTTTQKTKTTTKTTPTKTKKTKATTAQAADAESTDESTADEPTNDDYQSTESALSQSMTESASI